MYLGDVGLGNTVVFRFTTRALATGVPTTLAGTPSVAVYRNTNTTEITAGVALTVDFDAKTGLNMVTVVASGANGYAVLDQCEVVIAAGTVGGTSVVGEVVGRFTIEANASGWSTSAIVTFASTCDVATSTRLAPTTAGRTLDVSVTGEGGVDWANVGSPTTVVGLTGTTVKTATDVETDTQDIQSRLPAALVSGRMDGNIGATALVVSEPSAVPTFGVVTLVDALAYLLAKAKNKVTQTSTTMLLRNTADAATIATATVSDDAVTFVKGKDT